MMEDGLLSLDGEIHSVKTRVDWAFSLPERVGSKSSTRPSLGVLVTVALNGGGRKAGPCGDFFLMKSSKANFYLICNSDEIRCIITGG